jgi:hypothetical protein
MKLNFVFAPQAALDEQIEVFPDEVSPADCHCGETWKGPWWE